MQRTGSSIMNGQKYALIAVGVNPVCLICNKCLAMCKGYNLRRHFNTTHANFNDTFPVGCEAWRLEDIGSDILS